MKGRLKMHNLSTVIKFEILKQIRKPLFWIAIFAFPTMLLLFGGLSYLSTELAMNQGEIAKNQTEQIIKKIIVVDETGLVKKDAFGELTTDFKTDKDQAIIEFKNSQNKEALIIYPKEIPEKPIIIYTRLTDDKAETQRLSMGIETLSSMALQSSIESNIDKKSADILKAQALSKETHVINDEGIDYNPLAQMIIPGIFLAVFFIIMVVTGNQTLVATTEEKENRIAEMILTTVKAKTLISGKIIALVVLGFIQIIALLAPILIGYVIATKYLNLPPIISEFLTLANFEFWPTFFGATLLVFGFLLTTGFTILAGSLFPTAQDAAQFYTPIILGNMLPFYFAGAIVAGAGGVIVTFLSYFPLSAPVTLLLRNMAGNLPLYEGLLGLLIVIISSIAIMFLAVKAFRKGVFEYTKTPSWNFKKLIKSHKN